MNGVEAMAELNDLIREYERLKNENQRLRTRIAKLQEQKKQLYESINAYEPLSGNEVELLITQPAQTIPWSSDMFTQIMEER